MSLAIRNRHNLRTYIAAKINSSLLFIKNMV